MTLLCALGDGLKSMSRDDEDHHPDHAGIPGGPAHSGLPANAVSHGSLIQIAPGERHVGQSFAAVRRENLIYADPPFFELQCTGGQE